MSKPEMKAIVAASELDTAVTQAIVAANEAGSSRAKIAAVLSRIVELLESEE